MSINKLYIFSKNTDAFASQRGYNFQTLKTLETWISNFLNNIKDDIYCEFEEDIFQKDENLQKVKFRQIKLYSSNFSFSSEEIKKCICHFFTLHIKSDYNDFSKEFIFETNANIKTKFENNDAELLRDWFENQQNLTINKLTVYAEKVKSIVTEYVEKQKKAIKDREQLKEAIEIFESLPNDFWQDFSRLIKWDFAGNTPEVEFQTTKDNIESHIESLPYQFAAGQSLQTFGILLEAVFNAINEKKGNSRILKYDQLEQILLSIGSDDDKWYARRFEYYKSIDQIDEFRIGEYHEVINLANYCRRNKYLHKHKVTWNSFLVFYSRNETIHPMFRKKAIYEIVFLNNEFHAVDYAKLADRETPEGSLKGFEEDIRFYFSNFSLFGTAQEIEYGHNLINILFVAVNNQKVVLEFDDLRKWFVSLYRKINQKLLTVDNNSDRCNFLEQKGTFLMTINTRREKSNIEFRVYFDKILTLAEDAKFFKLSQFGVRIGKYIKSRLNADPEDNSGVIAALEDFSDKLFPLIEKREGKVRLAETQVKRGYDYLKTNILRNSLKALENFHRAKDNYLQEDTIEGYIISLLNIAMLYNSLGMHFAAKNYSLSAFRMSSNHQLLRKAENSFAILAHSDYIQGSWFNALTMYLKYFILRLEGNFDKSDAHEEQKAIEQLAFILHSLERSSSQFSYLVNSYLQRLDYIGDEILTPWMNKMSEIFHLDSVFHGQIEKRIEDFPLNDIGKTRMICFYALGSLWKISFKNTFEMQSVSEEYISAIQIFLAEVALSDSDFHLLKSTIEIELILGESHISPEQLPSNEILKWKIGVIFTNISNNEGIHQHTMYHIYSLQTILDSISVLNGEEFKILFWKFFKEADILSKQNVVNLYQKIHRDIYVEHDFNLFQAPAFENVKFDLNLPLENKVMVWKNTLSQKYDRQKSLDAIKNRYNNIKKSSYLTINNLKQNPDFIKWLNDLRSEQYKDWQILLNIYNFIVNHKIAYFEHDNSLSEKNYAEQYQAAVKKYTDMDEKDCYIEFPLDAFKTEIFMEGFKLSLPAILNSNGLDTKQLTPNFKAIRELLNTRFNMAEDDYNTNSPLKEIPFLN